MVDGWSLQRKDKLYYYIIWESNCPLNLLIHHYSYRACYQYFPHTTTISDEVGNPVQYEDSNFYIINWTRSGNIITCYVGNSIYKNSQHKLQKEESTPLQMLNKNMPYACSPPFHGSDPPYRNYRCHVTIWNALIGPSLNCSLNKKMATWFDGRVSFV